MDRLEKIAADWRRERPDLDASDALLVGRVLAAARKLERIGRAELAPFQLGLSDHDVLSALRRSGRPHALKPGQLLEQVVLTSGALSSCLDRLEARGLLQRRQDPSDGRSRVVTLTRAGRDLIDDVSQARFSAARALLRDLSEADKRQLDELLGRIEARAETCPPDAEA